MYKFKKDNNDIYYWYTWVNPRKKFVGVSAFFYSKKTRDKDLETFKRELEK